MHGILKNSHILIQWLEHQFLPYLEEWEQYAMSKEGLALKEKEKLILSKPTREGLKITGMC